MLVLFLRQALTFLRRDERGQGLTEYALLLAAIVAIVVIATVALAGGIDNLVQGVVDTLENPPPAQ